MATSEPGRAGTGRSEPGGIGRYATSTKNIAGCVLAVGGPVLALTGVLAAPLGLALIPALYAIGALVAPERRRANVVAGVDPNDVARSLREIQRRTAGRVPPEIASKIGGICTTISDTLPSDAEPSTTTPDPILSRS